MLGIATAASSPLWYLTRGTGATALILLTVSIALGVANVRRTRLPGVPRFVLDAVHRNAALLALAFLVVHIVTAVVDPFAPIRLIDTIIPFVSAYRPLWLGLGAVAFDLLIAVVATSLLRRRLGWRGWRATHWLVYASWPIAVVHGLGTGSDAKGTWLLMLTALCVLVVLAAVAVRVSAGWPDHIGARLSAITAAVLVPVALVVWLPSGPLASDWAKRAGTPTLLLPATSARSAAVGLTSRGPSVPFTAQASGTVSQGPARQGGKGGYQVYVGLTIAGQQLSTLGIRMFGRPIAGGGIEMTSSRVALGTGANPKLYQGHVTALEGSNLAATVSGGGTKLNMVVRLQIDPASGSAAGTVTVGPA